MSPALVLDRWIQLVVNRPWIGILVVLGICLAVSGASALKIRRDGLPLDFTPQAMFIDQGEEVARLRAVEAVFGREDNDVLVMLEGPLVTPAGRVALETLHQALEATPGVAEVRSPLNAQVVRGGQGELAVVQPATDFAWAEALAVLAEDPLLRRLFVSEDRETLGIRVSLDPKLRRVAELEPAIGAVRETIEKTRLPEGFVTQVTGVPWVRVEVVQRMAADQAFFFPLVAGAFAITVVVLFRRFWLGLAPLLAVVVADLWAMGALLLGGVTFNILSVLVPTLVVVIGVADGIHLTARFRDRVAGGQNRGEALRSTFRELLLACFLTTFTTAAGFFSLGVAETRVIRDFGLQAGVAMGFCLAALLVVLPVILAVVPLGASPVGVSEARPSRRPLAWLESGIHRNPLRTLILCGLFSLVAGWIGSGVRPNSRLLEMYGPETATFKAVHRAQDQLTGVIPVFFFVEGEPDSMLDPAALERLLALEAEMRAAEGVVWTSSPAAWIGQLHTTLGGDGKLPASREGVAQELLLAEISGAAPVGEVLDEGRGKARVIALMKDIGGRETLALRDRWQARADALYAGSGQRARLTGDGLLAAIGVNRLISDLISGIGLVFVVIAVTLAALLKDIRLALLACIPNLVPLLFSLATLRLIGADLQTSNIVSFTVAVGLAVDDTIHFSVAYHDARREGHNVADAIRRTLVQTGDGIVFTSVLLVAGFGILTISDLTSTKHFGLLTSVTMVAALLGDLVLFPALLYLLDRRTRVG